MFEFEYDFELGTEFHLEFDSQFDLECGCEFVFESGSDFEFEFELDSSSFVFCRSCCSRSPGWRLVDSGHPSTGRRILLSILLFALQIC